MKRCEECNQLKDELPFLYDYNSDDMKLIEERRTCEECWRVLRRQVQTISSGPMIKRNGIRYLSVTVVGQPLSGQLELF